MLAETLIEKQFRVMPAGLGPHGEQKVVVLCDEPVESWVFTLKGTGVYLLQGNGATTQFQRAKALAEGKLHEMARSEQEIVKSGAKNVTSITSRFARGHVGPDRATEIFNK